jgi:integrase
MQLRARIELVLDAARALGHIDADRANPARWRGHLDKLLPKQRVQPRHHPAMPYADLPDFMDKLRRDPNIATKALQFLILTGVRTNEAIGATWDEIDLDGKLWVVPGKRMKMGLEHRVPLGDAAIDLLRAQLAKRRGKQAHVFPGVRPSGPLSNGALVAAMRRLGASEYTVHGFRSSFRDWAADHGVDFDVAEAALAHKTGNSTAKAYLRSTMIARRRGVMEDWNVFLTGETAAAKVVPFKGTRRSN